MHQPRATRRSSPRRRAARLGIVLNHAAFSLEHMAFILKHQAIGQRSTTVLREQDNFYKAKTGSLIRDFRVVMRYLRCWTVAVRI